MAACVEVSCTWKSVLNVGACDDDTVALTPIDGVGALFIALYGL